MSKYDDEIKKSDAERLLLKAKEMELRIEKFAVRVDRNTVLLVSADKLRKREAQQEVRRIWSKKKANGKRKG